MKLWFYLSQIIANCHRLTFNRITIDAFHGKLMKSWLVTANTKIFNSTIASKLF